jgi:hypothetical protein
MLLLPASPQSVDPLFLMGRCFLSDVGLLHAKSMTRSADSSSSHPLATNSIEKVCDNRDVDQKHGNLNRSWMPIEEAVIGEAWDPVRSFPES